MYQKKNKCKKPQKNLQKITLNEFEVAIKKRKEFRAQQHDKMTNQMTKALLVTAIEK